MKTMKLRVFNILRKEVQNEENSIHVLCKVFNNKPDMTKDDLLRISFFQVGPYILLPRCKRFRKMCFKNFFSVHPL